VRGEVVCCDIGSPGFKLVFGDLLVDCGVKYGDEGVFRVGRSEGIALLDEVVGFLGDTLGAGALKFTFGDSKIGDFDDCLSEGGLGLPWVIREREGLEDQLCF
jgi:hypothetical protein